MTRRNKKRFTLLPQEHSILMKQTPKWGQLFLLSIVGLGATAIATAWTYRIDEVITVQGKLQPQEGGVEVKSPLTGQLDFVAIENGEKVKKGQTLLKYDLSSEKAEKVNLLKQIELEKERLREQLKNNQNRQITVKRNIELSENILSRLRPLQYTGGMSEVQILQQQNQLETQRDQLLQLETTRNQIIGDSNSRTQQYVGRLAQVENRLSKQEVKATIGGTVFDLKPDNNNYVTQNAEVLLKIVPSGNLSASVNVGNRDIGFIQKGQEVKVRVDSFPFTEYGEINGIIFQIGADALPPTEIIKTYHFPVDIKLAQSYLRTKEGGKIALQSGMTVTTNLKLRDRRLIELLSDLFTNRSESLKRLRQP